MVSAICLFRREIRRHCGLPLTIPFSSLSGVEGMGVSSMAKGKQSPFDDFMNLVLFSALCWCKCSHPFTCCSLSSLI